MMKKKPIPDEVRAKVIETVEQFNRRELSDYPLSYVVRFKGKFVYLDWVLHNRISPICRLKYDGEVSSLEFAIFKWSSETYDPNDWFFPGSEFVDGTVEGAMKAGIRAYYE